MNAGLKWAKQVQRLQPTSLAQELAAQALERARDMLALIKRKDARGNAVKVLSALFESAYTIVKARGQSVLVTTYTFFTVLDLLPVVTGLSSDQCERATRKLQELGLIHKSSGAVPRQEDGRKAFQGGTWTETTFVDKKAGESKSRWACAGTWIAVLLHPVEGRRAKVISHELPECPRDLNLDRESGRTAWRQMQDHAARKTADGTEVRESIPGEHRTDITPLVQWSLQKNSEKKLFGIKDSRTSAIGDIRTDQDLIWSLKRLLDVHPQRRREAVQDAASRLVILLRDQGWERHYYRLIWRALDGESRGLPAFRQLGTALQLTCVATRELDLKRPGAWLFSELRDCGWLDAVYRVAHPPEDRAA